LTHANFEFFESFEQFQKSWVFQSTNIEVIMGMQRNLDTIQGNMILRVIHKLIKKQLEDC